MGAPPTFQRLEEREREGGRGGDPRTEKVTHRRPLLPAMESLSPRLRRLVDDQCASEAQRSWFQEGITTCQAAACHADFWAASLWKSGASRVDRQHAESAIAIPQAPDLQETLTPWSTRMQNGQYAGNLAQGSRSAESESSSKGTRLGKL